MTLPRAGAGARRRVRSADASRRPAARAAHEAGECEGASHCDEEGAPRHEQSQRRLIAQTVLVLRRSDRRRPATARRELTAPVDIVGEER